MERVSNYRETDEEREERLTNLAGKINARRVGSILEKEGWICLDAWEDILIFRRPKTENTHKEIVLPKSKEDELYSEYMYNAARRYAAFHDTTIERVIKEWKKVKKPAPTFV